MFKPGFNLAFAATAIGAGIFLTGCAVFGPTSAPDEDVPSARAAIASGQYAAVFDSAKATLRDLGFELERVDAQGGVITTKPLGAAGIATPWSLAETGIDQEFEDVGQRQVRIARIDFVPAGADPATPASPVADFRTFGQPVEARVVVAINRYYASGLRINTGNIGRCTYAIDSDLESRGMLNYGVAVKEDRRLADRIVRGIDKNMRKMQAAATP